MKLRSSKRRFFPERAQEKQERADPCGRWSIEPRTNPQRNETVARTLPSASAKQWSTSISTFIPLADIFTFYVVSWQSCRDGNRSVGQLLLSRFLDATDRHKCTALSLFYSVVHWPLHRSPLPDNTESSWAVACWSSPHVAATLVLTINTLYIYIYIYIHW